MITGLCDWKQPTGWYCTRLYRHSGPCALRTREKTKDEIIEGLKQALARAVKDQVYGFFHDGPPIFVQGDAAGEVCDLITADDLNKWLPRGGLTLTKDEVLIVQKLLKGYVVGPSARKVLDKINAVTEGL